MTRPGRLRIVLPVLVLVVGAVLSAYATVAVVSAPSSGSTIVASSLGSTPGGVPVDVLPGVTTSLRSGDMVRSIDGRTMESWADGIGDPSASPMAVAVGQHLTFGIRRDAEDLQLDVIAIGYPVGSVLLASAGTLSFVLAYFLVGALVFWRKPRTPASGALLVAGIGGLASTVPFLLGTDPMSIATGLVVPVMSAITITYLLLWAGAVDFALVFPRPSRRLEERPSLRAIPYVVVYGAFVVTFLVLGPASGGALGWLAASNYAQAVVIGGALMAVVGAMALAWRRSGPEDRRVLRGVALGGMFTISGSLVIWFLPELVTGRPLLSWTVAGAMGLPLVLSIAAAIVRHRAFGVETIARRSVIYAGSFIGIVLVYAVSVAGLTSILGGGSTFAVQLLAAGAAAVAALPIRDLLQRGVNRFLYGDRQEPVRALRRLGERLEWAADPEAMPEVVVEAVAAGLRSPFVALELGSGDAVRTAALHGDSRLGSAPHTLSIQLVRGARPVGRLIVAPRSPGEPYSSEDIRLLDDLAFHVAAAADAILLADDLRRSRERIIRAGEEERVRIRRDLHDGLGPTLVAIGMRAEAAADYVATDPEAAHRQLDELRADVAAAVADIRRLVDGLRPAAVDELGLVAALQLAADRLTTSDAGPAVVVTADPVLPELTPAVEVAAYRIATEAMTNAARHAGARRCDVRLVGGADLMVVVEDDGRGLPSDPSRGVGLASMRERATEIGGELTIADRDGGGTRVEARLPLLGGVAGGSVPA
jgi:signal transduction histidine kinase